ncbi:hypothetical protein [Bacillus mesophilum]|uniref:Uncharacterized protein n=1 Tax=Bacillus mesophilum TaxID=1071718 RepID=A0A7V7RPU0_9BACI|nr:hypothetical protein [Bacillus mesophilum]KAB2335355.1 hypothetical protein F7732_01935 [Bacillus mesophilum]
MRVLFELIRIIFIFAIVGGLLGNFFGRVYLEIGIDTEKYGWMGFLAIFILFFVLYRNKLQFSGWYKGEGREKLPKIVSRILIFSSIILILLPPFINFHFN